MTPSQKEMLTRKLWEWGHKSWARNKTGCYYDSENMLYKIWKEKVGAGQKGRNIALIDYDEEYERVDQAIKSLEEKYRCVVIKYYSDRGEPNLPLWDKLNIGKSAFYNRLHRAHRELVFLV